MDVGDTNVNMLMDICGINNFKSKPSCITGNITTGVFGFYPKKYFGYASDTLQDRTGNSSTWKFLKYENRNL